MNKPAAADMGVGEVADLIQIFRVVISTVILILGVSLLLLTMTNHLGQAIDQAQALAEIFNRAEEALPPHVTEPPSNGMS